MHLVIGQNGHQYETMDTCSKWYTYSTVTIPYTSSLDSVGVTTYVALVLTIELWRKMYRPDNIFIKVIT